MLRRIRQLWWLILALLLAILGTDFWHFNVMELFAFVAIVVGAFFAIRSRIQERRRKQKRKAIIITLSEFLEKGKQIKSKCFEKGTEAPTEEAEGWADNVGKYLNDNLGSDYATRFHSYEGLPVGFTTLSGMQAKVESYVGSRLARLNQFLAELIHPY